MKTAKHYAVTNRRRRRLLNEIIGASNQLALLDAQVEHTPYAEDLTLLKKQQREMRIDLAAAKKDLRDLDK